MNSTCFRLAYSTVFIVAALSLALLPVAVEAQDSKPADVPAGGTPAAPAPLKLIAFHPPGGVSGGILPNRIGGGSRGASDNGLSVEVLAPENVALTTQEQPSLYWYQTKETTSACELTISDPHSAAPILRLKSSHTTPPGIHVVRLSKFNVKLQPDVVYSWSMAIVVDPQNRSQDVLANGVIKRVQATPDLSTALAQAKETDKPGIYAANGIWVDALQSISDQIEAAPQDASLRKQRDDLLHQVGLTVPSGTPVAK